MPSDIFRIRQPPDTYMVIGRNVTPSWPDWPIHIKRVAVPVGTLLCARTDILEDTESAPDMSVPRENMPDPMQLPDGTIVIEGVDVTKEGNAAMHDWGNIIGPVDAAVLTRGFVLRVVAERLPSVRPPLPKSNWNMDSLPYDRRTLQ